MWGTRINIALTLSTATRCAAHTRITSDSRRVQKVEEYIARNYSSDTRLCVASRKLVDSTMSVAEICYDCGFNNVSNFNRIFKRKRGCSPKLFRENYRKNKVVV